MFRKALLALGLAWLAMLSVPAHAGQQAISFDIVGGTGARPVCAYGQSYNGWLPDGVCTPIGIFDPVNHTWAWTLSAASVTWDKLAPGAALLGLLSSLKTQGDGRRRTGPIAIRSTSNRL